MVWASEQRVFFVHFHIVYQFTLYFGGFNFLLFVLGGFLILYLINPYLIYYIAVSHKRNNFFF